MDLSMRIQEAKKSKSLDLSSMRLVTALPPSIKEIKYLKSINLYKNLFQNLPEELFVFNLLEELNLYRNKLHDLPNDLSRLSFLKIINLGSNLIEIFPKSLLQLTNLEELDLSNNDITYLPSEIDKLSRLRNLSIFRNKLKTLPGEISHLLELKKLDVSSNSIINLPSKIGELKLQILSRSNLFLLLLTFLQTDVSENPLRFPPIDIVRKGKQAILDFLLQEITDPLKCVVQGSELNNSFAGIPHSFLIITYTFEGTRRIYGGDNFVVKFEKLQVSTLYDDDDDDDEGLRQNEIEKTYILGEVSDNYDGTYLVNYILKETGEYKILISLYDNFITQTPSLIKVESNLTNDHFMLEEKLQEEIQRRKIVESKLEELEAKFISIQNHYNQIYIELEKSNQEKIVLKDEIINLKNKNSNSSVSVKQIENEMGNETGNETDSQHIKIKSEIPSTVIEEDLGYKKKKSKPPSSKHVKFENQEPKVTKKSQVYERSNSTPQHLIKKSQFKNENENENKNQNKNELYNNNNHVSTFKEKFMFWRIFTETKNQNQKH